MRSVTRCDSTWSSIEWRCLLADTADKFNWLSTLGTDVTRAAVREGFEHFVEDAIEETAEHFSVARALRSGARGPGGSVVDRLLKNSDAVWSRVVEPELQDHRRQTLAQFEAILDYAESDEPIEAFRDRILEHDAFASAIRTDIPDATRQAVIDSLLERHRKLAEATVPLIESPEDDFWTAARTTLDRAAAERLVEQRFVFVDPIRSHTDAIALRTTLDPGDVLGGLGGLLGGGLPTLDVEYTDEAVRAMGRAEQAVIAEAKREIDQQF